VAQLLGKEDLMGEEREFGDAVVSDAREESGAINAGEGSFSIEDAGSNAAPVKPPAGERWVDVTVIMRFAVTGEADSDMVGTAVHRALAPGDEEPIVLGIATGTAFASNAKLLEVVKISGIEQGIGQ
jgi:hypothetical protein